MARSLRAVVLAGLIGILLLTFSGAAAQSGPVVIVNTGAVHVRSGPAPNTTVIGTLAGGVELAVTGRNADTTWWRVTSPFGVGWVSDLYVVFRGTLDAVPVVSTPAGTLEIPTLIIDGYPATVYRNPDVDSFVVGIAPTGAELTLVGMSPDGNWWQVQTTLGLGWLKVEDAALRGDINLVPRVGDPGPAFDGPTVRVNAATPVTSQPGSGTTIATLPAGTALPAGGRSADNTWWQVGGTFGIGWIPVANVSLSGASDNIRAISPATAAGPAYTGAAFGQAVVEVDRKVAYASYTFDSDPMWDAHLGDRLGVVGRSMDGLWLHVVFGDFTGWMNFSGLTLEGSMAGLPVEDLTPVIENIVIVNIHRLHIRSGPGAQYQSLTSVPGGTVLDVTGRHPTLPWIRVTGDFGVGWVRILYIIFRGNWNDVPVVTEPVGGLEMPVAIVEINHHVYSQPAWDYPAGALPPGLYTIIGWTADYKWAKIESPLGDVWIHVDEFLLRGTAVNAPVLQ